MADRKKFEEMLERLINEDKAGAEELFHEIVVEKSREIYEALLENDLEDEDVSEASDEEVDEASDEEVDEMSKKKKDEKDKEMKEASDEDVEEGSDEEVDEDFNLDEFEVEADPMAMGGDPADAMMGDVGGDEGGDMDMDMGGEEGEEGLEDRVVDLEDALDELKAEFEKLMSGEEGEEEHGDMDMGGDEEGESDDEEGESDDEEGDDKAKEAFAFEAKKKDDKKDDKKKDMKKSAAEEMREYVEKIGGATYNQFGKMGDNGQNTKSPVANAPKNTDGVSARNLNQGKDNESGDHKGFSGLSAKEDSAGNVNVPGSKNATKMSSVAKGHGAEKKGAGEQAANKKSIIGGK